MTKFTIRFRIAGFDEEGESHTIRVWRDEVTQAFAAMQLFAARIMKKNVHDFSPEQVKVYSVWASEDKSGKGKKVL